EVFLVVGALGQWDAVVVGIGNAQVFGLATHVRAHAHIAVSSTSARRVHGQTEGALAAAAVLAESAGDVERQHDSLALAPSSHPRADLFDDAHVLVAEHDSWLGIGAPFVHVQIRATDAGSSDAHQRIGGRLDFRVVDLVDGDFERLLVDDSPHGAPFGAGGRS